jgi:deoxyribonuclease V
MTTAWPATAEALVAAQRALASLRPEPWRPRDGARAVGGCFVCFARGRVGPGAAGDEGRAAAAVVFDDGTVQVAIARGFAPAAYVPGLLGMRDGPLLEAAVLRLPARPDVLLVNATGRDHPERAGLAVHLGARLDIPTIGVTAQPLMAHGDLPADDPGATSELRIGADRGQVRRAAASPWPLPAKRSMTQTPTS